MQIFTHSPPFARGLQVSGALTLPLPAAVVGMDGTLSSSPPDPALPSDLFLRILALLPPKDLAFSGRLACKEAAQRFMEREHRTVTLDQPLPSHVVTNITTASAGTSTRSTNEATCTGTTFAPGLLESAEASLRELTFRRKLLLLSRAAASGCEVNCSFAWQLLQPHVFPELLQSDFYRRFLALEGHKAPVPDVGSAAVASGLAHLLPSLVQRCPGLLDPGRTLEAAAQHCDLAELQAAWGLLEQRLQSSLEEEGGQLPGSRAERVQGFWQHMLAGAAGSTAPEASHKMEWVLANAPATCDRASILSHACGAAAASGDLARVRWLRERGLDWSAPAALAAMVEHAGLAFVQQLEEEGGYLPSANAVAWHCSAVVSAAAAAPRDSEAKLQWLAGRGACLEQASDAMCKAAGHGNLAALELLVQHWRGGALPENPLFCALLAGSISMAVWLRQAGCTLTTSAFNLALHQGNLPMVSWLLEAGSPRGEADTLAEAIRLWPRDTAADGQRLVEALQLLAAAGWPMGVAGAEGLVTRAAHAGHPWTVWHGLLQLFELQPVAVPRGAARYAAAAGCRAMLEALVGLGVHEEGLRGDGVLENWYAGAASNGDRGTLAWLRRQRLPWGTVVMFSAAIKGAPLPALRWLVEQGAPLSRWETTSLLRGASSLPLRLPLQEDVEEWLRDCSKRWRFRVCPATVWVVCVLGVAVAVCKAVDGGQFGVWASAEVFRWWQWCCGALL